MVAGESAVKVIMEITQPDRKQKLVEDDRDYRTKMSLGLLHLLLPPLLLTPAHHPPLPGNRLPALACCWGESLFSALGGDLEAVTAPLCCPQRWTLREHRPLIDRCPADRTPCSPQSRWLMMAFTPLTHFTSSIFSFFVLFTPPLCSSPLCSPPLFSSLLICLFPISPLFFSLLCLLVVNDFSPPPHLFCPL